MMHKDAFEHYERWRRQWLDGGDSNAIQILHFHGLHDALLLTSSKCPDPCHAETAAVPSVDKIMFADLAMVEAASQIRRLLGISLAGTSDENHLTEHALRA